MQSKRLFWTCPHCGREVVWESGPYILQNGTEFFCPYCEGGTIITMQKGHAAQHGHQADVLPRDPIVEMWDTPEENEAWKNL